MVSGAMPTLRNASHIGTRLLAKQEQGHCGDDPLNCVSGRNIILCTSLEVAAPEEVPRHVAYLWTKHSLFFQQNPLSNTIARLNSWPK